MSDLIAKISYFLPENIIVTTKIRLAEEPFIVREPGSGTRMAVERFFADNRVAIKVEMEIGSNEAIVGGLGVSMLSSHVLALEGTKGPLTILDVQGFPIQRYWYVVYPASKQLSVVARTFLEYLFEEGKRIATPVDLESITR